MTTFLENVVCPNCRTEHPVEIAVADFGRWFAHECHHCELAFAYRPQASISVHRIEGAQPKEPKRKLAPGVNPEPDDLGGYDPDWPQPDPVTNRVSDLNRPPLHYQGFS